MKVESNIPLPAIYPFAKMKVGDSFAIPADIKRTAVSVSAKRFGVKHNMRFTIRKMPDGSYRCWRLE